jgi:signal transduction histidine kinase/CheY-like chemotaxis protein
MTRQTWHLSLLALTGAIIAVLAFVVYRGQLAVGIGLILTGLILALALLVFGAERAGSSASATGNRNLGPGQAGQGKDAIDAANRVKSEFLATMSHEIRTPMNAVLGMTDLLRLTDLTRKQLGYLQTVQSSGDMLLSLLDNILDYTRLEAGGIDFHEQEFDVSELLATVLQIMGYQAYSKGLELIADDLAVSRLRVCGDNDRLRQILVNLVSNAIKFSDEGEVVIEAAVEVVAQDDVTLRFSVSDHGAGMPEGLQKQLYKPFETLDIQAHGAEKGSGIGLTISKRLVENMGGEIGVNSVVDEGTTVWFTVPVQKIKCQQGEEKSGFDKLRNEKGLVINGNSAVAGIICRYLESWGMDCTAATDATSALERFDADDGITFSVAVIDVDLADNDGLFLARQIRARRATADLPIVLLTSIVRPLEIGEISAIGNIRCVNKPILPSELQHNLLRLTGADAEFAVDTIVMEEKTQPTWQLRVLIAEDNMVNSRMLLAMLISLGCYPDIVGDGHAALKALAREAYDLVLMDCQMPGMDGDQVTRELRNNPRLYRSQPVVIAVTADNSAEHRRRCLESGMDGFMAKPIRLEKLRSGLEQWPLLLGSRRTPDTVETGDENAGGADDLEAQVHRQLNDRAGAGGSEFVHNYIDLFLEDTEARLEKLRAALLIKDTDILSRESHALKGTCLEFGVVRMGQYCDNLRAASEQGKLEEVSRVVALLDKEFVRVRPVFEAERTVSR